VNTKGPSSSRPEYRSGRGCRPARARARLLQGASLLDWIAAARFPPLPNQGPAAALSAHLSSNRPASCGAHRKYAVAKPSATHCNRQSFAGATQGIRSLTQVQLLWADLTGDSRLGFSRFWLQKIPTKRSGPHNNCPLSLRSSKPPPPPPMAGRLPTTPDAPASQNMHSSRGRGDLIPDLQIM
jgi:hypothetical protein